MESCRWCMSVLCCCCSPAKSDDDEIVPFAKAAQAPKQEKENAAGWKKSSWRSGLDGEEKGKRTTPMREDVTCVMAADIPSKNINALMGSPSGERADANSCSSSSSGRHSSPVKGSVRSAARPSRGVSPAHAVMAAPSEAPVISPPQAPARVLEKGKTLDVKKVNVKEYDDKFDEIAKLYNNQVENYLTMKNRLSELNEVNHSANLTSCMVKIKEKYEQYDIQIQMKGYSFTLLVKVTEDIPDKLQKSQDLMKELNRATKVLIGSQTKLGGMVFSVSQIQEEMANKIKEVNTGYLDQIRLVENLEKNMKNIEKAKLLSAEYEKEASKVLTEVAHIAGVTVD